MSRRARSRGSCSHNAKAGFACKELRRYSPTNVFVPDDDYPPMGQCVPYVPIIHSDAYGPHAIQLYTPPLPTTPTSVPFPTTLPIPAMYFLPFMIPPYHDPYGPTAVQIYSPYIPPVVKMRSIRDVIGLGQDSDVPMPYHRNEATPFQNHSMLSALPTPASVDFSTNSLLHFACPVLGLVIIVALGVSTLYCALKKLRQHEQVAADTTEFEEYHNALSSFEEEVSGLEHLKLQEGDNIPKNDKATRTEQLNEHWVRRINGSAFSGAREKIKFAPGRRRLRTELLKESGIKVQSSANVPLVPRKRS